MGLYLMIIKLSCLKNTYVQHLKMDFGMNIQVKIKVFIFKFKDGETKKYVLNNDNEKEILKLCCEFAECEFESIDKMLRDNEFYAENYYEENISDNIFQNLKIM